MQKNESGCLARSVEGLCGVFVFCSIGYLLMPTLKEHLTGPQGAKAPGLIYPVIAILGGLLGLFLPEIFDFLGRQGLSTKWVRLLLGIVAAATFTILTARVSKASWSGAAIALLLAIVFWLIFEATTSGLFRFEPGSMALAVRTSLNELMTGVAAGVSIGFAAGLIRAILGYSDISGNMWLFILFPCITMAVGVGIRLVMLKLLRSDSKTKKKDRRIAIADGLVLGAFIGMITAMPTPPINFGDSTFRSGLLWVVIAPIIGFICGLLVGGISALFRFAVGGLVFAGESKGVRDIFKEILGWAAIDPPREEEHSDPETKEHADTGDAAVPSLDPDPSPKPRSKFACCCLCGCALPVIFLVGLIAFLGKTVDSDRDFHKIPYGCPPSCVKAKMSAFMIDCVPTRPKTCANFAGADMTEVDLSQASVFGVKFKRSILRNASLKQAVMEATDLTEADLSGADLRGVSLNGASLIGAKLINADLRHASLHGANLIQADLDGANLQGALYDSRTEWPRNFDPIAAGARKEGF